MLASTYQKETQTTAIYPKDEWLPYLILGLSAEAGEIAGKLAKFLRKDAVSDKAFEQLKADIDLEISDVLWFCSQWCNETGTDLGALFELNINKLKGRAERGTLKGSGDAR